MQRSAQDAFGTSIGRDSIGLYSPSSVRGFSPAAAGNFRIDGLYADTVADLTDLTGTLIEGSAVKVGPSVLGYSFPAPTGIADFRLRLPGGAAAARGELGTDVLGGAYVELNGEIDVVQDRLAVGAGFGLSRDATTFSEPARHLALSGVVKWRPFDNVELIPFAGYYWHKDDPAQPRYIVANDRLPPRISRRRVLTQPWSGNDADEGLAGLIARWRIGDLALDGGVFAQQRRSEISYSDQFSGVTEASPLALHKMVATPSQRARSISGEIRLSKMISEGPRRHHFKVALRGRSQRRSFGGSASASLGLTSIDDPEIVDRPDFSFRPQSADQVRQIGMGIGYHGQWQSAGEVSVHVQKILYRKALTDPSAGQFTAAEKVWTYSGMIAAEVTGNLAIFAGVNRGFEEIARAPDSAVNRDEAPAAAPTTQHDAGLRWLIAKDLRLVAGVFSIRKPYYDLDSDRLYRALGTVRHRGFELSLTGEPVPNLNLLAGLVALDDRVSSLTSDGASKSTRPVATPGLIALVSGDYKISWLPGLSVEARVTHQGRRAANSDNSLFVPANTGTSAGVRYQWSASGVPMSARLAVSNLLNRYAWEIRASNSFFYSAPRTISLRLNAQI